MNTIYKSLSYPVLVAFVFCCLFSTYTPGVASAATNSGWHTVLTVFGAVAGAAVMATLAASFGTVGIVCAGILGAGIGLFSGAVIGGLIGRAVAGNAWQGIGIGATLGVAIGSVGAAMLAAQFGIVAICASALLGASTGAKFVGLFDDDNEKLYKYNSTVKNDIELGGLRKFYLNAQEKLRSVLNKGSAKEQSTAHNQYIKAQRQYFDARSPASAITE